MHAPGLAGPTRNRISRPAVYRNRGSPLHVRPRATERAAVFEVITKFENVWAFLARSRLASSTPARSLPRIQIPISQISFLRLFDLANSTWLNAALFTFNVADVVVRYVVMVFIRVGFNAVIFQIFQNRGMNAKVHFQCFDGQLIDEAVLGLDLLRIPGDEKVTVFKKYNSRPRYVQLHRSECTTQLLRAQYRAVFAALLLLKAYCFISLQIKRVERYFFQQNVVRLDRARHAVSRPYTAPLQAIKLSTVSGIHREEQFKDTHLACLLWSISAADW